MLYSFNNFLKKIQNTNSFMNKDFNLITNYAKFKFKNYFPKFDETETKTLIEYLNFSLYVLMNGLNIENDGNEVEIFLRQLSMNNDRNFLAIVNLFLPYIDDKDDSYNQKNITNFDNIVTKMNDNDKAKYCNYIYDHNFINEIVYKNEEKLKKLEIGTINEIFSNYILYFKTIFYFITDIFNRIKYKFYINWINSFPLTIEKYKNSKLYKRSFNYNSDSYKIEFNQYQINFPNLCIDNNLIDKTKIVNITNESIDYVDEIINKSYELIIFYRGINLEDIYNTFVNDYYLSIKANKWLLFEFENNDKIEILIFILHKIFDINKIIEEKSWFMLNIEEQHNFEIKWKLLKDTIKNKKNFLSFKYDILRNIFVSIVSYFEIHYKNIIQLTQKDKTFINLKNDLDEDDDIDMFDITKDDKVKVKFKNLLVMDYYYAINNVPIEHIYNFLFDEINKIKLTPYNFLLFENKKLKNIEFNKINLDNPDIYKLTPKNFYNFSKSLIFKNFKDEYNDYDSKLFPRLWESLSVEDKYIIAIRLNQNENQNWFNILSVLSKSGYTNNLIRYQEIIYNKIRSQIVDLTFENLIRKGCISKFEYNPSISDSSILPDDYETKNKKLADNMKNIVIPENRITEFENAYYFVNNKKYKDQNLMSIKDKKDKHLKCNYVEYVAKYALYNDIGDRSNTFYAVDWVSQIDFYMKFLNQRVMYVTGATGQGKSTQVPKLYLYGLKSFLYKNDGKIFCTVPRIDPVLENAKQISSSMGLGIEHYNDHFKENVRTLEGTIQYKYADDSHINVNNPYYLRILTDGSLIMTLRQNPLLKEKKNIEGQYQFSKNSKISGKNLCDIVMIDEAHEHNTNMDLILTLMKYSLFYNNDIKLSIISATMETDEPIFRKFYRFIDDNLMYPININNLNYGLDRNLIDRRYHISPPGKTTQHTVTEYYEDGNNADTYEENEKLAIDRVRNIFTTTTYGDILLFSVTVPKISALVEKLNSVIPNNCVSIPYYSKMAEKYKIYSKKADVYINKLSIDKRDIDSVFSGKIKESDAKKVNQGTYNRACIIATNAAEASLTIKSLKFIVDIGYQFSVKYNYETKTNDLVTEKITEASRIQRKGRVGRTSDGTVYHMYPKQSREPIKAAYNISISDFSDNFKDLLTTNNDIDNQIIDKDIMQKLLTLVKLNNTDIKKLNSSGKIIHNQYNLSKENYLDDGSSKYISYSINIMNNDNIYNYYFPSYFSGYDVSNLLDISGHFYIINPLEQIINRDINNGNIVDKNGKIKNISESDIIKIYERAESKLDLIKLSGENKIFKSGLANEFENISMELDSYDNVYSKIISLSLMMNNSDDGHLIFAIIFICELLENIQNDISKLVNSNYNLNPFYFKDKEKILKNLFNFYESNKVTNSEFEFLYKIFLEIISIVKINEYNLLIDKNINNISFKLLNFYENKNLDVETVTEFCKTHLLDSKMYENIIKLILNNDVTIDGIKEQNKLIDISLISKNINQNKSLLNYCINKDLNFTIIAKIVSDSILKFLNYFDKFKRNKFSNSINNLKNLLSLNTPKNNIQKIKIIFLYCYSNNIIYNKNGIIYNLFSSNVENIKKNLLSDISNHAFFLNKSYINNSLEILSNITKEEILNFVPNVIRYIDDKGKDQLNYKDLENNINFITQKFSNIKNKKIDNQIDKNISNIYMEQIILKPSILNKKGGLYFNNHPVRLIMKLNIESVKKIPELMEHVEKSKAKIDFYKLAYVITSNSSLIGFFLVKKIAPRTLFIYKVVNYHNSYAYLHSKLTSKNYIILTYK